MRYVLEGSVRKAEPRAYHGAAHRRGDGQPHWAERYDREATDIFAIQDEITEKVVASLEPQLFLAEGGMARQKATDLDAWDGMWRVPTCTLQVRTREGDCETAVDLLERAIECDPQICPRPCQPCSGKVALAYQGWFADRDLGFEAKPLRRPPAGYRT